MGLIFNGNGDVIKAVDGSLTVEGLDLGGSTNIEAGIGTFSGNLNVGGVLTYEDVKNVDSVGIVTARAGINLTGGNITLGDSGGNSDDKLVFGAGGDLKIFHQADQSRIVESGPSVLKIMGSDVRISNAGNTADYFQGNDGSDVKLFHNGNLKFATTSGGIDVTGAITVNGSALSSGGVIQTKSTTRTNQIDVSVNIDVDYGSFGDIVAVTITPTSSSNKILIMYTISGSGNYGVHLSLIHI